MATGDIREIDMTKVTNLDGKKIRLVGDDGKGYWIEKEDLAAVVGGLINPATDSNAYGDLNNVLIPGIYCFSNMSNVGNSPANINIVATLIVSSYSGQYRVMQTAIGYNGVLASRFFDGSNWTSWSPS